MLQVDRPAVYPSFSDSPELQSDCDVPSQDLTFIHGNAVLTTGNLVNLQQSTVNIYTLLSKFYVQTARNAYYERVA